MIGEFGNFKTGGEKIRKLIILAIVLSMIPIISEAADLSKVGNELASEKNHLTLGCGVFNDLLGVIRKNGLGEPKHSLAINPGLLFFTPSGSDSGYGGNWQSISMGFSWTTYFGSHSTEEILNKIDEEKNNLEKVDDDEAKNIVKYSMANKEYYYFRIGTMFLFIPIVLQGGKTWFLSDNFRVEAGVGSPTLLNFGANYDF